MTSPRGEFGGKHNTVGLSISGQEREIPWGPRLQFESQPSHCPSQTCTSSQGASVSPSTCQMGLRTVRPPRAVVKPGPCTALSSVRGRHRGALDESRCLSLWLLSLLSGEVASHAGHQLRDRTSATKVCANDYYGDAFWVGRGLCKVPHRGLPPSGGSVHAQSTAQPPVTGLSLQGTPPTPDRMSRDHLPRAPLPVRVWAPPS